MERTGGGTRALTKELKYLNLDLAKFQHLPEEDEHEDDIYYGIEKGECCCGRFRSGSVRTYEEYEDSSLRSVAK